MGWPHRWFFKAKTDSSYLAKRDLQDDKIFDKLPERVVSGRWRHSDPNSLVTNVNKSVAFALLQNYPAKSY